MAEHAERKAKIDRALQEAESMGLRVLLHPDGGCRLKATHGSPNIHEMLQGQTSETERKYIGKLVNIQDTLGPYLEAAAESAAAREILRWLNKLGFDAQITEHLGSDKWLIRPRDRRSNMRRQGGFSPNAFEVSPEAVEEREEEAPADSFIRDDGRILGRIGQFRILTFAHSNFHRHLDEESELPKMDTTVGYGFSHEVYPEKKATGFTFRVGFFLPENAEVDYTARKRSQENLSRGRPEAEDLKPLFGSEEEGELLVSIRTLMTFEEVELIRYKNQWGLDTSQIIPFLQMTIDSTRGALATRLSGSDYGDALPVPTFSAEQMLREAVAEGVVGTA